MWKWIGGCFLVCILLVGIGGYMGYRKLKGVIDRPPVASVTIAATPQRVFASMADADSLSTWMTTGAVIQHHGILVVGDTFALGGSQMRSSSRNRQSLTWKVTEIKPPNLIVYAIHSDSTGMNFATLRDSLVQRGDSTEVVSTYAIPDSAGLAAMAGQEKSAPAVMQTVFKAMLVAFAEMKKEQLATLKGRIEGKPVEKPSGGGLEPVGGKKADTTKK